MEQVTTVAVVLSATGVVLKTLHKRQETSKPKLIIHYNICNYSGKKTVYVN